MLQNKFANVKSEEAVSMFPTGLYLQEVLDFQNKGFKPWLIDILYEYKIDLYVNKDAFKDGIIRFTSTKYQFEYDEKYINKWFRKYGIDRERAMIDNEYWESINQDEYFRIMDEYTKKREEAIKRYTHIPVEQYDKNPYVKEYINTFHKWVKYNLKYGLKHQYASYIPHIHTPIVKPLEILEMSLFLNKK